MGRHDWYRNSIWNKEIEQLFEAKFKCARCEWKKSQYLRIQASYLLQSKSKKAQRAGLRMMERFFKSYSHEISQSIQAWQALGDYYSTQKKYPDAEQCFIQVVEACREYPTYASYGGLSELKIAEMILVSGQKERLAEAYQRFIDFPSVYNKETFFNSDLFYVHDLAARLCYAMEYYDEAKTNAIKALELAQITEPQLPRHSTVGLVHAEKKQIALLKKIAKG